MSAKLNDLITELEKKKEKYNKDYMETGDEQSSGVAIGIEMAIEKIRDNWHSL